MIKRFAFVFIVAIKGLIFPASLYAQLIIKKIGTQNLTVDELVKEYFLKGGIQITHIESRISKDGVGVFNDVQEVLGIKEGIVLATGNIDSIKGPNHRFGMSSFFKGIKKYADEDFVTQGENFDAMVLKIEFVPVFDSICFEYCFGSEEYPEFVNSQFNDLFVMYLKPKGIKVNEGNIARLPNGQTVCINLVNAKRNAAYFIDNTKDHHFNQTSRTWEPFSQQMFDTYEYDGFTRLLTAGSHVFPGKTYELKIIICDLNDRNFDSGVFLKAKSFRSIPATSFVKNNQYKKYTFQFDVSKSSLREEALNAFPDLATYLKNGTVDTVYVIGHTDSSGYEDVNQILSVERAEHIKNLLVMAGVDEKRIRATGRGSAIPLKSNATEEGRMINRRVEILLYRNKK